MDGVEGLVELLNLSLCRPALRLPNIFVSRKNVLGKAARLLAINASLG